MTSGHDRDSSNHQPCPSKPRTLALAWLDNGMSFLMPLEQSDPSQTVFSSRKSTVHNTVFEGCHA
jgi:hypothetical protein